MEDILDQIENESLYEYLKKVEPLILKIIEFKINGYNIDEIYKILGISVRSIYRKIKKVTKNYVFVAYIVNPLKKYGSLILENKITAIRYIPNK